ncbi:hypothetical protein BDV26DRAFT_302375 [Aspergillus bertholletiae]|uniref:NAD(P)-binding protein n=1 Tax=Aspergillus bertholletiae TaxID=1226010 RepID=A0A5N7APU2_9EURO|nr:hypothetical protein BDV26DRAFT_302375 [Aspergillus bertholletiae]
MSGVEDMAFSLQDARAWNASLKEKRPKMVAVFVGGTSGIGEHAARQLALAIKSPTIYVIGRNEAAGNRIITELKESNPNGSYIFKPSDISDLQSVDTVCNEITAHGAAIDLLFLTAGALGFSKQETKTGIDRNHILRYYSRMRFVYNLISSLEKSENPRVVSIYAAGKEVLLDEDNLDLKRSFSISASNSYPATMTSLLFEVLATQYPTISFIHEFPGFVATPLLKHSLGSIAGSVLGLLMKPLMMNSSESGEWNVFLSTSPSFPPKGSDSSGMKGVRVARSPTGQIGDGVYLLNYNGKDVTNQRIMEQLRASGFPSIVENHTLETLKIL